MKKRTVTCISFVISVVALGISAVLILGSVSNNIQLKSEFSVSDRGKTGPYIRNEPLLLSDILDSYYSEYASFEDPKEAAALSQIRYYASPKDLNPVVVIESGDTIILSGERRAYGVNTYPTYSRGWRIVQPFARNEEEYRNLLYAEGLYVKLKDMNSFYKAEVENRYGDKISTEDIKYTVSNRLDQWLYNNGYYISPDLYCNIWSVEVLVFLGISIAGFLVAIIE